MGWNWCWHCSPSCRAWCPPLSPNRAVPAWAAYRCHRSWSMPSTMWAFGILFRCGRLRWLAGCWLRFYLLPWFSRFTAECSVFGCTPLLRRFRCLHSRVSLQAVWVKLHPQLCGCVFAGRGGCVVLHYFIRHFVQPARCGYKRICCHRRLDLCRRTGVQPAGAGRCHQRLWPHCERNHGIVSCRRGFFVV